MNYSLMSSVCVHKQRACTSDIEQMHIKRIQMACSFYEKKNEKKHSCNWNFMLGFKPNLAINELTKYWYSLRCTVY